MPRPLELGREACCAGWARVQGVALTSAARLCRTLGASKIAHKIPQDASRSGTPRRGKLNLVGLVQAFFQHRHSRPVMDLNTARARLTDSRRSVDLAYERLSRVVDAGQLATGSHRVCEAVCEAASLRQGTHPPPLCGGRHARPQSWTCPRSCRVGYAHQGAGRSAGSGREAGEGLAGSVGGWSA